MRGLEEMQPGSPVFENQDRTGLALIQWLETDGKDGERANLESVEFPRMSFPRKRESRVRLDSR